MIQVYTGDGKGKTTAALGLAIRAYGAGWKVYIAQFIKGQRCSEINALTKIKNIKIEQFGSNCFIKARATVKEKKLALRGLATVNELLRNKKYDLIILDELNVALKCGLFNLKEILNLIKATPVGIELVITGRDAHPAVIKMADLVSEIKEIKHYYKKGIQARRGIEF
jgi:cob(I)alamin adenosyltransferase